jgi:hypothetical protein
MTYSKIHKRFSERLEQPDALKNPEKYLGPNYQDVLNFWIYLDTLSDEEKDEIESRYYALDDYVRDYAIVAAENAADDIVGFEFRDEAWCAAYDVTGWAVFAYTTLELIGHHKLLEQNKSLIIVPLTVTV